MMNKINNYKNNGINNCINKCKINNKNNKLLIIEDLLSRPIPNKQSKQKISDDDFTIPQYKDYNDIIDNNYNTFQLKKILKKYNIKNSGNKDELKKRCYNFLSYTYNTIIIQSYLRKHFVRNYILYHGPAFKNKELCTNDVDFGTLDDVKTIPYNQFISIKDNDDFIYGFDIQSLYNLFIKNNNIVENPYSTKKMDKNVYEYMMLFINYSKILKIDCIINYDVSLNMNSCKLLEMKILNLFQNIDSLGNYTNMGWFNNLTKNDLIKFYRELLDIWNYRANLSYATKMEICHPSGNPFRHFNYNINYLRNYSFHAIKKNIVNVLEEFVYKGIDENSKSLGSLYILSALTLVSNDAAEAMPWLFDSVNYVNNNYGNLNSNDF